MSADKIIPPTPTEADYAVAEATRADHDTPDIPDTALASLDPFVLFDEWFKLATRHEINDANAMALATVDATGLPDVRMVLLKDLDPEGFVFYTNLESAKGSQLDAAPKAALNFHWKSLRRAVRIRGQVVRVSDAESDAYFASRTRSSQLGAWASAQSRPMEGRFVLERKAAEMAAKFGLNRPPRPPFWGGFRVVPTEMEFWRDRPFRLHDRIKFVRASAQAPWQQARLFP